MFGPGWSVLVVKFRIRLSRLVEILATLFFLVSKNYLPTATDYSPEFSYYLQWK